MNPNKIQIKRYREAYNQGYFDCLIDTKIHQERAFEKVRKIYNEMKKAKP